MLIACQDANTKRETGREAQLNNIMAGKVSWSSFTQSTKSQIYKYEYETIMQYNDLHHWSYPLLINNVTCYV